MATSVTKEKPQVPIRHEGGELILPKNPYYTYADAIKALQRQEAYENEVLVINHKFIATPLDGAWALHLSLQEMFTLSFAEAVRTFFGTEYPKTFPLAISVDETVQVPWGRFTVPGMNKDHEFIETTTAPADDSNPRGVQVFSFAAKVFRKNSQIIAKLAEKVHERLLNHSVYRGKAIRVQLLQDDGKPMTFPGISFIDTRNVKMDDLVYSESLEQRIKTYLWTPIQYPELTKKLGVPLKRGFLLRGEYGVGKTLLAYATAKVAEDNKVTFIYAHNAAELSKIVPWSRVLFPGLCVVFVEDVDRVLEGVRDESIDSLFNTVDGVESKSSETMLIMTTNNAKAIQKGMRRMGRVDVVMTITPPDAGAAARLIKNYSRGLLATNTDLTAVSQKLAHKIPAMIREAVERAKLAMILRDPKEAESGRSRISEHDLNMAIDDLRDHEEYMRDDETVAPDATQRFAKALGEGLSYGVREAVGMFAERTGLELTDAETE